MREQLIQYVDLLFAGAVDCADIKQEILQNTLDRYDDLIAEGKVPEAAYRLAISGIGDINEILGTPAPGGAPVSHCAPAVQADDPLKRLFRAVAVALYILSPTPLFILSEMGMATIGLCGTLAIVAVATVFIILGGKKAVRTEEPVESTPGQELKKSISSLIWTIGLVLYFILSFSSGAWHITWLVFPLCAAVQGLAKAILDLMEANKYEN